LIDNYNIFFQFIDLFLPCGFAEIDKSNPVLQKIEEMTESDNQFFFIADLIKLKILFTSRQSINLLGIDPHDVDPGVFFTVTHPEDLIRHNIARTKLFNLGQQLYIENEGKAILSTNFRFKNTQEVYRNIMVQCYLFFSNVPYKTVFLLQVMTDISWFKKIKHGFHYYIGNDLSCFRYPDEKLLLQGIVFSNREFIIIKLLAEGLSSAQIATQLFLSIHTIYTHRRNILKKTKKASTNELILELKARGMI